VDGGSAAREEPEVESGDERRGVPIASAPEPSDGEPYAAGPEEESGATAGPPPTGGISRTDSPAKAEATGKAAMVSAKIAAIARPAARDPRRRKR